MVGSASASGDVTSPDFGRRAAGVSPGDGEGVFLAKGLLREFRAKGRPFGAGALMVVFWIVILVAGATGLPSHYAGNAQPKKGSIVQKQKCRMSTMYKDAPPCSDVR